MKEQMMNITSIPMREWENTSQIKDPEGLMHMKQSTPARIGIGHAGSRYTTDAYLRFLADQAAASDATFSEVSEEVIEGLDVLEIQSRCQNKLEMITRPDWGRIIEEDQQQRLLDNCMMNPDVQIYFGDGLSAPAISANIPQMMPVLRKGLEHEGITVGTPFFVRYCRVNTARTIGPLLKAKVVCVLIGERPGLITDESMSAYIAYKPHQGMQESQYTVLSNISRQGMPPVESAAHIVDMILKILKEKRSGIVL